MPRPLVIDAGTVQQLGASAPLTLATVLSLPSGSAGELIYLASGGGLHVHNGASWSAVGGGSGASYYSVRRAAAYGG